MEIPGYKSIREIHHTAISEIKAYASGSKRPLVSASNKEKELFGGLLFGEQWVIAARNGVGKSAFVLNWMRDFCNPLLNPAYAGKLIILVDSFEMQAWRFHLRHIASVIKQDVKSLLSYHQNLKDEQIQLIEGLTEDLVNLPIYYRQSSFTVDAWYKQKEQIYGPRTDKFIVNIVDHTRLITSANENSEMDKISDFLHAGLSLKRQYNMLNIFLSQMNRSIETSQDRSKLGEALPINSDLFGSDAVGQTADGIIALHRPGMYGLGKWKDISTGLTTARAGDDTLTLECLLKARDGSLGTLARRHNLAHFEYWDDDNTKAKTKVNLKDLNDDD